MALNLNVEALLSYVEVAQSASNVFQRALTELTLLIARAKSDEPLEVTTIGEPLAAEIARQQAKLDALKQQEPPTEGTPVA